MYLLPTTTSERNLPSYVREMSALLSNESTLGTISMRRCGPQRPPALIVRTRECAGLRRHARRVTALAAASYAWSATGDRVVSGSQELARMGF